MKPLLTKKFESYQQAKRFVLGEFAIYDEYTLRHLLERLKSVPVLHVYYDEKRGCLSAAI